MEPTVTIYGGTYYWRNREDAKEWANNYGWPIDRIIEFGRGHAVQCGPSGNYAGPDTSPRPWTGYKATDALRTN
jgi:hypothetical protein